MKETSIKNKFTMISIVTTIVILLASFFVLNYFKQQASKEVYQQASDELHLFTQSNIEEKM